jgi:hypothetical protein
LNTRTPAIKSRGITGTGGTAIRIRRGERILPGED